MCELRRCQYIKADDSQCGAPALRDHHYCYFHHNWRESEVRRLRGLEQQSPLAMGLPDPMDENALHGALTEVMRLMLMDEIDDRRAGLLLYALQTASNDLNQLWYCDSTKEMELSREAS